MPELPEVETVLRGMAPVLAGQTLQSVAIGRKDLRRPFPKAFAKRLTGCKVLSLRRRAKYILADLSGGQTLVLHLGMSGRIRLSPRAAYVPQPHDHAVLFTQAAAVAFNDPRRFGLMTLIETDGWAADPLFAGLGPEPLSDDFTPAVLAAALAGRKSPVKTALLDQSAVAGLGNIYVCEALFRARISPLRPACAVRQTKVLTAAIKAVLTAAIAAGGSTLRDSRYVQADGALGYFQNRLNVYDREGEPCPRRGCHGVVQRVKQSGRSSFYCPACQK